MNLVFVLGTSVGGIGKHVRDLAASFAAGGHDVLVVGPAQTEQRFAFTQTGARFAPVRIAAAPHPMRDASAVRALRRLSAHADVVHAHGVRAGALTGLAVGRRPVGRVVTLHNAMLASGVRAVALSGLERLAARRADVVLGASQDLVDRAWRLGARDARLGPVPAAPLGPPRRGRDAVRAELGLGDADRLVVAVGRLATQKDYPMLLRASALLGPGVLVAIAGDGPLRAMLQERIDAAALPVRLLGHRRDVADLLAAADVFALPSLWEARALVAQEAMRAAVPVVATAVGGTPDLLGAAGLLVPAGDAHAMAAALLRVLGDPAERDRLAAAGIARAAALPGLPECVAQLSALYSELSPPRAKKPR